MARQYRVELWLLTPEEDPENDCPAIKDGLGPFRTARAALKSVHGYLSDTGDQFANYQVRIVVFEETYHIVHGNVHVHDRKSVLVESWVSQAPV